MEHSTLTITGEASGPHVERAQFIGHVMQLAARTAHHNSVPLQVLADRALTAHSLEQAKLYFNDYGQCVGYVIWALLSPEVERRFLGTPDSSLHISEWNEGGSLWILDFVVPYGSLRYVMDDLRDQLFPHQACVTYFKYKNRKRMAKRMSRDSFAHFFKRGTPDAGNT